MVRTNFSFVDFLACQLELFVRVLGVNYLIGICHKRILRMKELTKNVIASEEMILKCTREQDHKEVYTE